MSTNTASNENERNMLEKRIEALNRHQQQHKAFLDTMEGIRWKFTTAFGFGAGFGLFFASPANSSNGPSLINQLAASIAVIISLAGVITQVRIYALIHSLWYRIRCLQRAESRLLGSLYGLNSSLQKAIEFPQVILTKKPYHFLTVHMAVCIVFCSIIGLVLCFSFGSHDWYSRVLWFIIPTIILVAFTYKATDWYTRLLTKDLDINNIE